MRTVIYSSLALVAAMFASVSSAYAGDGATIVLKSGTIVYVDNGFKQLIEGMQSLKRKGSENYPIEINIEGTTFYINLGEVAVLCRDKCTSLDIVRPKQESR